MDTELEYAVFVERHGPSFGNAGVVSTPMLSGGRLRQKVSPSRTSATPCNTFSAVIRLSRPS
jgi:hypothetical protein